MRHRMSGDQSPEGGNTHGCYKLKQSNQYGPYRLRWLAPRNAGADGRPPDILTNPTDIVLALDRSGSMAGEPLANVKLGAKTFIDIIENATGGSGQIGSGSRIGVVSFATNATDDTQLITSVDELKNAVDALSSGGSPPHADAFAKATQLVDPLSGNARVIVMFTDGNTTTGAPPAPVAAAAAHRASSSTASG